VIHDFGIVWNERGLLMSGLANTALLSVIAAVVSLLLGAALAPAMMSRRRAVAGAARAFVDAMRCIPFLLFAYMGRAAGVQSDEFYVIGNAVQIVSGHAGGSHGYRCGSRENWHAFFCRDYPGRGYDTAGGGSASAGGRPGHGSHEW